MRRKLVAQQNEDGSYSWVDPTGEPVPIHENVFDGGKILVRPAISEKHPHLSQGAACHPSQVQEFNDFYKKHGIRGAIHQADGTLESHSRAAFNGVLKARGLMNKDAGYGDWSGNASDPEPVDMKREMLRDPEIHGRVRHALERIRSK